MWIYVNFLVSKSGEIDSIAVIRGAMYKYKRATKTERGAAMVIDREAERVVGLIKIAEPAYENGKPVNMHFTLPLNIIIR